MQTKAIQKNFIFILILIILTINIRTIGSNENLSYESENNIQKLQRLLKVLNVSTHLEGDIDSNDKLSLTTRVIDHLNGETYYFRPDLKGIDGKFSYSNTFSQENSSKRYSLAGQAKAETEKEHNLSIHVQNFDLDHEEANQQLHKNYAKYLKKYIDYLYSNNIPLKPSKLKDLKEKYVYYGSISNGSSPAVEAGFELTNLKKESIKAKKYSTLGGTQKEKETSVSYGVGNFPGEGESHSIQSAIASSTGDVPISGMQIGIKEIPGAIESGILGQAVTEEGKGVSMTIVDAIGVIDGEGITNNSSYSENEDGILATIGETANRSVDDSIQGRNLFPSYFDGTYDVQPVTMDELLHGQLSNIELDDNEFEFNDKIDLSKGIFLSF